MPFDLDLPAIETHLLGLVDYLSLVRLQQRLVEELALRNDGRILLLLCEHPPVVTVGRTGRTGTICRQRQWLKNRGVDVRWVGRGGGPWLHLPGQLAIYPLVPLRWYGFSVGEYLQRLQRGVCSALEEIGVRAQLSELGGGLWGRTGQLAVFNVGVRQWITHHGAFVNVSPAMGLFCLIDSVAPVTRMSCLVAERGRAVRMASVRAAVARHLAEALGCGRYHLHTGHPLLQPARRPIETAVSDE